MGILEKIADIEREIARTQKNKGTWKDCEKLQNSLTFFQLPSITWAF